MELSNPENIANMIIKGCDDAERLIRQTLAAAPSFLRTAVDHHPLTFMLPDDIKIMLVQLHLQNLTYAADLMADAIGAFRDLARAAGRPTELRAAADVLNSNVAKSVENLTMTLKPRALLGLQRENWDSRATEPYGAGLTEQVVSAGGILEVVTALETTLRDMADSIVSFYGELGFAYAGFLLAVIGLAMVPTTGPGAIVGIILAVIGLIMAIISVVVAFTAAAGRHSDSAETLGASPFIEWRESRFSA